MKALVVYDTVYGNTEKVASVLKENLNKKYDVKLIKADAAKPADLDGVDLLLVGSPTHGGWYIESVKTFLNAIPANGLKTMQAAAFDTSTSKQNESGFVKAVINFFGYASKRIAKSLAAKGATMVSAETFPVIGREGPLQEGEIEHAKSWAEEISK
jgi:flavodoxin